MARSRWYKVKRWFEHQAQKAKLGFSSEDLWNLDMTIAEFIAPRLKAFRKSQGGHPACYSEREWNERMDKMIRSFDLIREGAVFSAEDELKVEKEINEGLKIFAEDMLSLWT